MEKTLKILFTEEANEFGKHCTSVFKSYGFEVRRVSKNGSEVLRLLELEKPDVLVMDAIMSSVDALGVLQQMSKNPKIKKPLVMVVSGVDNQRFENEVLTAGADYLELIQKDERSNTPIAKAHANCWRNRWMLIKPNFERVTGQRIHAGMKVLLKVHAQFHENYGFSWIVDDIDPNYTMGDMARKRLEIVNTLKAEGVFELQKELVLPMFCQRIAVISSATAAGYGDFCNQLADNDYGLQFTTRLFPATMQGEGVEQSIIAALDSINAEYEEFDCVVIIRGGGATSDLSGFDTLALAENVANFPLPIITGIGHERDESVLDMISFQRVKTPTAAAAFLINHLAEVYARVMDAQETIVQNVKTNKEKIEKLVGDLERLGFVELENELDGTYKVTDAFHYIEELIDCLTIYETEES